MNGSNQLQVYEFEGCTLTPIWIDGEPWFLASEVAKILRFRSIRMQVSRLAPSEADVTSSYTSGQGREVQIISEIGLYKLCFASRSPFAVKFQEWVAGIVKQVRKHGFYVDERRVDDVPQEVLEMWRRLTGCDKPNGGLIVMCGGDYIHEVCGTPVDAAAVDRAFAQANLVHQLAREHRMETV